ncbi:xanthine dehydrogenase subunit XdhA [Collinsella ihumii]|uniref:xanthine dehydrogenase subunit XdhA n=1 Tax=Collinsella ihumii TaxID=1720204 RepID=UPI0025AA8E5A|nr:xanthine dehydrogenase subunit XdhA [Collinsella ihumii]MDN0055165.1 xanthine dehydrogenase molybdenum-binding subunit XdhA [Collinsella ihumii]
MEQQFWKKVAPMHEVGAAVQRVDAIDKVKGTAKYTDDLCPKPCLVARVVHAQIANGWVRAIDTTEAESLPGVVAVFTFKDVPEHRFPTPGHPWSVEPAHQDVADRRLLDDRVRIYGDDIAVVVAEDNVAADRGVRSVLSHVDYEELPPMTTVAQALAPDAPVLHPEVRKTNVLAHSDMVTPLEGTGYDSVEEALSDPRYHHYEAHTETQQVDQTHIETNVCYAYMESGRITVVSSTQIPHIVRRVCGQALGVPWGTIRVIKPYIGGGFGNKQEVLYEPLCAWLTSQLGGRVVEIELPREEVFQNTRSRHPMSFDVQCAYDDDMNIIARSCSCLSNQGGYASHGHALAANAINAFRWAYKDKVGCHTQASTVYTNIPAPGAMRAYGMPQGQFTVECMMDDIARKEGWDPIDFRLKNLMPEGYSDPFNGITNHANGFPQTLIAGREASGWDDFKARYRDETGPIRHGIGMSAFVYKTGVYPISLETSTARLVLNQDGTCQLSVGATEIGQGADTVFSQMAAETIGVPTSWVHIVSFQDTDVTPFDTGAYASRQTYVTGHAVRKTAEKFRQNILDYAYELKPEAVGLDIAGGEIVDEAGEVALGMEELAQEAFYSFRHSVHIHAEETAQVRDNTFAFGTCFVKVEVDMPLGRVKILDILNVHDSGRIINPATAEGQVHGGMAQGIGAALYEEQLIDPATGRLLNPNLLDYKIPTSMDVPDLKCLFVETDDPSGPYGNKALGEPPLMPPTPAIRNAILDATGCAFYQIPMTQQRLVAKFKEEGLI